MTYKQMITACALVAGMLGTSLAQAHAKIEAAEPKADSVVQGAPAAIRLHFNEPLEGAFSKIELDGADAAAIALPKAAVDKSDRRLLVVPLPALKAGQYHVRWSAMTHDGHKVKGDYRFRVK